MELRLHIGAHRTGSTRIQLALAQLRDRLQSHHQTLYFGPEIRPATGRPGTRREMQAVRRMMADRIGAQSPARTIYSEENLLGTMRSLLSRDRLYPDAISILSAVIAELPHKTLTICLCIRSYAAFWTSVYAQTALRRPLRDFSAYKARMMSPDSRWPQLIDDLAAAFPDARILVWDFDDGIGRRSLTPVLRLVTGIRDRDFAALRDPRRNAAPAQEAIEILRWVPAQLGRGIRHKVTRRYRRGKGTRFAPWTAAEQTRLDRRYAEDLTALRSHALPNVQFVELKQTGKAAEVVHG